VVWSFDPNADSDADGHRGHPVTYVEDDRAEGITAQAEECQPQAVPVDDLTPFADAVRAAISAYQDRVEPEAEDWPAGPDEDEDPRGGDGEDD